MSKTTPTHYPVNLMALATQLGLDAFQFNALKYICRAGKKENETYADDISKAIESLQMGLDHHAGKEPAPPEQRFTPSDMAEYHNPDHPANAVKCPKASEPADPEWDAAITNMTTPA